MNPKKVHKTKTVDIERGVSFDALCEALEENLKKLHTQESEPFEKYCYRIQLSLLGTLPEYPKNLLKGYQALLDELSRS